jgi:hypothetical protein
VRQCLAQHDIPPGDEVVFASGRRDAEREAMLRSLAALYERGYLPPWDVLYPAAVPVPAGSRRPALTPYRAALLNAVLARR